MAQAQVVLFRRGGMESLSCVSASGESAVCGSVVIVVVVADVQLQRKIRSQRHKPVKDGVIPKLSQETLGEMVGTTRSRVSFFMNRFSKLASSSPMVERKSTVHFSKSL